MWSGDQTLERGVSWSIDDNTSVAEIDSSLLPINVKRGYE